MTDAEIRGKIQQAFDQSAAAMEAADEAKFNAVEARKRLDSFIESLPNQLREMGVLSLSHEQAEYLLNQIGVGLARELLERHRNPSLLERKWVIRTGVATMITAVTAILALVLENLWQLQVLQQIHH